MAEWNPIDTAPSGILVMTKIDDAHGPRNEQALVKKGRLWFVSDLPDAMYVYYGPTHWRPLNEAERLNEARNLLREAQAAEARAQRSRDLAHQVAASATST